MTHRYGTEFTDGEFEAVQSELLLNLIAIVKIQQLNIELLWEALGSGKAPQDSLLQMRESSVRLTDSIGQVYGKLACNEPAANYK